MGEPGDEVLLRGRVLDADGTPVARASVWAVVGNGWQMEPRGRLTQTDKEGRFELASIPPRQRVFASASGRGCSPPAEPSRELELVLEPPVGDIEVVALAADGSPVVEARVRLRSITSGNGHMSMEEFSMPSDRRGRALFEGVPATAVQVFVHTPGLPLWRSQFTLASGERRLVEVLLLPGFAVEGRVTDSNGRAVVDARVFQASRDLPGPPFSQYFEAVEAWTDEHGRYRLHPLPPGTVKLEVESSVRAATQLTGQSGDTLLWDPVLVLDLTLSGRLLLPSGAPLAGWQVKALPVRPAVFHDPAPGLSDPSGTFVITGVQMSLYDLRAFPPSAPRNAPYQAELRRVRPADSPVKFVVSDEQRPSAWVTGRILDAAGMPIEGVTARALRRLVRTQQASSGTTGLDGRFELGPLVPGSFPVEFRSPEFGGIVAGPVEVEPGVRVDMGDVVLALPGQLELSVRRSDGEPLEALRILWQRDGGSGWGTAVDESGETVLVLAPGTWRLSTFALNATTEQREVRVRSGQTTRAEFVLGTGARRQLRFNPPESLEPRTQITVRLRGPSPERELEFTALYSDNRVRAPQYSVFCTLAPGRYTYLAGEPESLWARGSFEVEGGPSEYLGIDIALDGSK
jgi:protocatechuate 3,4-dioxygenase beta subunit